MEHNLEDTISLLARTHAALDALLRDLPETWTLRNEGENTWSAFDVVGHLIHCERTDWMPRAKRMLEFDEARAFEPFDRWAQMRESEGKQLGELLGRICQLPILESGRVARSQSAAGGPGAARAAPCPWHGDSLRAALHLGRLRSDSFAPDLEGYGPSMPQSCGLLEQIPWGDALV